MRVCMRCLINCVLQYLSEGGGGGFESVCLCTCILYSVCVSVCSCIIAHDVWRREGTEGWLAPACVGDKRSTAGSLQMEVTVPRLQGAFIRRDQGLAG